MNATTVRVSKTLAAHVDQLKGEIGGTPLLHFRSLSTEDVEVFAKAEWVQLSGSVKARAAYNIVVDAIAEGKLHKGVSLLDASSGNTAIAYGAICKKLDIKVTICLPENASTRRIELLRDLGVEIVFTSPFEGTEGSQARARELKAADPDKYFYADQYGNPANWKAHYHGTATEILMQTNRGVTHFVAGLGTTGTFVGTARRLKEELGIECTGLQPDSALHLLEGWKHLETADVPKIYDDQLADKILEIDSEEAVDMMRRVESEKGLRISPSSAANLVGAEKVARSLDGGIVVTVLPDSIDRYRELEKEVFNS